MKPITVSPITKELAVRFDGGNVSLPDAVQEEIDIYWEGLLSAGKSYSRGEVFTVTDKRETETRIEVTVSRTDYAHYLFCRDVRIPEGCGVRIIHTATLVETSDGKTVFGRMGGQTARSGVYQLCGGGIDNDDLKDGFFDFEHNIHKELEEELGICATDREMVASCVPAYFKEGGSTGKMTVVYRVSLTLTSTEFKECYDTFVTELSEKGEDPEFGEIVSFDRRGDDLSDFLRREDLSFDEYMRPLFEYLAWQDHVGNRLEESPVTSESES